MRLALAQQLSSLPGQVRQGKTRQGKTRPDKTKRVGTDRQSDRQTDRQTDRQADKSYQAVNEYYSTS